MVFLEDIGSGVMIFYPQDDSDFFFGTGEEGVGVVNVDLGLEEGTGDVFEVGGIGHFHPKDFTFTEEKGVFVEEETGFLNTIDYDAEDSIVGSVYSG